MSDERLSSTEINSEESDLKTLSVQEQLKGKHILITGVTGFVGKVLLTMIAAHSPSIRRISVLIRSNRSGDAKARFETEVIPSEPFKATKKLVDERSGEGEFTKWVDSVISPVTGDITEDQLGLSDQDYHHLTREDPLELIIHCAGNVNFDPPLNEALEVNTLGAQHKVALARDAGCPLVHMSTCFVVGERSGPVTESSEIVGYTPNRRPFDPQREVREAVAMIERWRLDAVDQVNSERFYQEACEALEEKGMNSKSEDTLARELEKIRSKWLKNALKEAGMSRAKSWGWTNTYTYTKSLGEQLTVMAAQEAGVALSIVRPAIVESAQRFPFVGWNEGINTCAPIVYLYWKGQRFSPSDPDNILDVVPVDWVCQGTLLAAAELLEGNGKLVYQLSTGGENPLRMRRAIELTNLAWRAQYDREFKPLKRHLMRNLDTITVSASQYKRFGAPAIEKATRGIGGLLKSLPKPAQRLMKPVERGVQMINKSAQLTDTIFTLFAPFILENNPQFVSDHVIEAAARLSEEERLVLG